MSAANLTLAGVTTGLNVPGISTLGFVTSTNLYVSGISTLGFVTSTNLYVSGISTASQMIFNAGTTSVAPLTFTLGTNLTTPVAGAMEYDGTYIYATPDTTSGRGQVVTQRTFRLTSNGSDIGATIADFYGATSAINLAASSVYKIKFHAYFTKKTSSGTATWTLTASSAPTLISGYYIANPVTGIAPGSISGYTGSQAATTAVFSATSSLSIANHSYMFEVEVVTNAATTFKLQLTQSAGVATPLAGSYYTVERISTNAGSFA